MTDRNDVTTEAGAKVIAEIDANIERANSLAEADNVDALAALKEETETLIASLAGKGSIGVKKEKRDAFTAASQAQPKAKAEPKAEVISAKDYTAYEGVSALVAMGAERAAEGVRMHIKTSTTAKEIANVILDMWRRIPNKDGNPDIKGDSDAAKKASSALYKAAGEALGKEGLDGFDVEQAVKKLIRSVQTQRTDVRAEYLRSLDEDTEDATEERKHFAALLADKPEDASAAEFLAAHYGVGLKGEIEKSRERWQAKQLTSGTSNGGGGNGGSSEDEGDGGEGEDEPTNPDDQIRAVVRRLRADIAKAKPEAFEAASDETKVEVRSELETLYQAIKDMITATL
ncbi:hypothetical protein ACWEQ3_01450 [Streptomyces mirabilis]